MTDKTENTLPVEQCGEIEVVASMVEPFGYDPDWAERLRRGDPGALDLFDKELRIARAALASHPPSDGLVEALEPFAKIGGYMRYTPESRSVDLLYNAVEADGLNSRSKATATVGDFRRAHAVLAALKGRSHGG